MMLFKNLRPLRINFSILFSLLILISVIPGLAEAPGGLSKAYRLVNLREASWEPNSVTALAWLGDTLVVAEFGGVGFRETTNTTDGKLWLLTGVPTAEGPGDVTRQEILSNLPQPMGLWVENGVIYMHQKSQMATEIWKVSKQGNSWASELFAGGWGIDEGKWWHNWPGGLMKKGDHFYFNFTSSSNRLKTADAVTWPPVYKGTFLKLNFSNPAEYEIVANGLRTTAAVFNGPFGNFMGPDVQGEWKPDNQLLQIRPGRFYGHSHEDQMRGVTAPPAVTMPQGAASNAPGDGVYLTSGAFAGHMLMGDQAYRGINRYQVESMNGNLQGTVMDFFGTKNLAGMGDAHPWAIEPAPDGKSLVFGCAGGWWVKNPTLGSLGKLVPTGVVGFEVYAIRNLNATTMEVEFTLPVNSVQSLNAASWTVTTFTSDPRAAYGAGVRQDNHIINPTSIAMAPGSNSKVHLTFTNSDLSIGTVTEQNNMLQGLGYVLQFDINVTSSTAEDLYDNTVYYTLNQFGPGIDPKPGCMQVGDPNYDPSFNDNIQKECVNSSPILKPGKLETKNLLKNIGYKNGVLTVDYNSEESYTLRISDLKGKVLFQELLKGKSNKVNGIKSGLYMITLYNSSTIFNKKIALIQ